MKLSCPQCDKPIDEAIPICLTCNVVAPSVANPNADTVVYVVEAGPLERMALVKLLHTHRLDGVKLVDEHSPSRLGAFSEKTAAALASKIRGLGARVETVPRGTLRHRWLAMKRAAVVGWNVFGQALVAIPFISLLLVGVTIWGAIFGLRASARWWAQRRSAHIQARSPLQLPQPNGALVTHRHALAVALARHQQDETPAAALLALARCVRAHSPATEQMLLAHATRRLRMGRDLDTLLVHVGGFVARCASHRAREAVSAFKTHLIEVEVCVAARKEVAQCVR